VFVATSQNHPLSPASFGLLTYHYTKLIENTAAPEPSGGKFKLLWAGAQGLINGKWKMENGEWKIENGKLRIVDLCERGNVVVWFLLLLIYLRSFLPSPLT